MGDNEQIVLAVNQDNIKLIFDCIKTNSEFVWIDGKKVFVINGTLHSLFAANAHIGVVGLP